MRRAWFLLVMCGCAAAPAPKKVSFEEAMGWRSTQSTASVSDPHANVSLATATRAFTTAAEHARQSVPRGAPMPLDQVRNWEGWLTSIDTFIEQPKERSSALDAARLRLQLETQFENEGVFGDIPGDLVERIQHTRATLTQKLRSLVRAPKTRTRFAWPVSPVLVTSPFGERVHPIHQELKFHFGVDLMAERGQPVFAAETGDVIFAGWNAGHGKQVEVLHANGFVTRYSHLTAIEVSEGQHVTRGEVIGGAGQTGMATGPHLHFEVRHEGVPEDPEQQLPDVGQMMGAAR